MSRTNKRLPHRFYGFREQIHTKKELIDLERCRDEAKQCGVRLSEHRRYVPTKWDDIKLGSYREARYFGRNLWRDYSKPQGRRSPRGGVPGVYLSALVSWSSAFYWVIQSYCERFSVSERQPSLLRIILNKMGSVGRLYYIYKGY